MQNPFTTTFSKAPEYTYIATDETRKIIDDLDYEHPSESVYKITGVRGSGKTVILAKIEEELKNGRNDEWIVLDINPTRDILNQIAAMLLNEGFEEKGSKKRNISISATVMGKHDTSHEERKRVRLYKEDIMYRKPSETALTHYKI